MAHLIHVYDAARRLNTVMLGEILPHDREKGILGALERVFDVIADGACSELVLRGEDDYYECLTNILDAKGETPEERAEKLAGIKTCEKPDSMEVLDIE